MSGDSKQTTTQQSQTNPWAPAQPFLQGILGQLQTGLGNTGLTGAEGGALDTIVNNSNSGSATYAPMVADYAKNLLGGGGALNQQGAINQNYQDYLKATQPLASSTNYDPYSTPGFRDAINTLTSDITQGVNGQFAAAGRDFSGANSQALSRGIAQGVAPVIQSQFNANRDAQQGAASSLFNAGNTNAGLLTGLQQQYLTNQGQGVTAAGQAVDTANAGANAALTAEAQRRGIPVQNLGLLANIGIPIAGLGGQSSGTSTTTNSPSMLQNLQSIANLGTSLFGGGGAGGAGAIPSAFKFISDRNAKEDIKRVGTLDNGLPVYVFRYKGDPRFQIGLMAQDVEQRTPEAVGRIGEYLAVDYKLATEIA